MELSERHLVKLVRAFRSRQARGRAARLWARVGRRTGAELRALVEGVREAQTWAFAELLCEKSAEAASHRADRAVEMAELACRAAELAPGGEVWRSRILGYALAFLANAQRVANRLKLAEETFARALQLWEAGAAADPGMLAPWSWRSWPAGRPTWPSARSRSAPACRATPSPTSPTPAA